MIALVYDPAVVTTPADLAESLGVGVQIADIPPAYAGRVLFPDAGYLVVRETWAGLDILPGPVTPDDIAALPDPGPDPGIAAAEAQARQRSILSALQSSPINVSELEANLDYLAAFVGNSAVAGVPRNTARLADLIDTMVEFVANPTPTNEDAVAAIKAVCENSVAVDRVALAVLADLIRYTLQR